MFYDVFKLATDNLRRHYRNTYWTYRIWILILDLSYYEKQYLNLEFYDIKKISHNLVILSEFEHKVRDKIFVSKL